MVSFCLLVFYFPHDIEKRRDHASIERPKKYHQRVPTTPHKLQTSQPFSVEVNITPKAIAEIGKSANQRTANGKRPGPSSSGLFEIQNRTEVIVNKQACSTGAVIRARGRLRIMEVGLAETDRSLDHWVGI